MTVVPEGNVPHQDMGAISVVGSTTFEWCAERWAENPDPRRLRVNLVIETDTPFIEETWLGRSVALDCIELKFVERCPRCLMIDIDQDGVEATGRWLKPLTTERGMFLAVYADVAEPGWISLGAPIVLGDQT